MSTVEQQFVIAIPIYDGVDLMDVAAPREIFSWMGEEWSAEGTVRLLLVAETHCAVTTRDGMRVLPDATFIQVPNVDVMWVPGAEANKIISRWTKEP